MRSKMMQFALALLAGSALSMAAAGGAQSPAPQAAQAGSSTRFILLGTAGGPVPRVQRSQPANLLDVGGRIYLIDAGDGVMRQLAAAGYRPGDVQTVFLSHLHLDHVAGLSTLLGMNWVSRANKPMTIHGPVGTKALVEGARAYLAQPEALFTAQIPPGPSIATITEAREIAGSGPVVIFQDDRLKVTAVENSHYDTMDPAKLPKGAKSFAYRFDTADRSIVYTGDSGPSEAMEKLAQGADILVSEVIDLPGTMAFLSRQYKVSPAVLQPQIDHMEKEHFTPEEIGRMAARAGVGMVVLTHIVMGFDTETDMRAYTEGVRRHFKGPVVIGRDLNEY